MSGERKIDPLRGMNPNQSGPIEKIQNGDPNAAPNVDQRSGGKEAGGPGPSLQTAPTGDPQASPAAEGQVVVPHHRDQPLPEGVSGEPEPEGARDSDGSGTLGGEGDYKSPGQN